MGMGLVRPKGEQWLMEQSPHPISRDAYVLDESVLSPYRLVQPAVMSHHGLFVSGKKRGGEPGSDCPRELF
jgi:hypothetical protein